MQLSQIPTKFQKAFASLAAGGNIRAIPVTTPDPDGASQELGFPPSTMTAVGAGGVPPDGRDMNGVLNNVSAWVIWQAAGGVVQYDAVFQAAIGGYPRYSVIGSVTAPGTYWQSTADNNTTNPDTGGANWTAWPPSTSVDFSSPPPIGDVTPNSGKFSGFNTTGNAFVGGTLYANVDLAINGVGFSQSFGVTGYQKLPSGLIMQWGRFFGATGADLVTFPVTFPNNCTVATSAATAWSTAQVDLAVGFGSFTCRTYVNGVLTAGVGVGWIAIGN